jgi:hypothetical protein
MIIIIEEDVGEEVEAIIVVVGVVEEAEEVIKIITIMTDHRQPKMEKEKEDLIE